MIFGSFLLIIYQFSETQWEVPEEGFIKIRKKKKKKKDKDIDNDKEKVEFGPVAKVEVFSNWETVRLAYRCYVLRFMY